MACLWQLTESICRLIRVYYRERLIWMFGEPKTMQTDKKQGVILALTVFAFGFLAWQIVGLIRDSGHRPAHTAAAKSSSAAKPASNTLGHTHAIQGANQHLVQVSSQLPQAANTPSDSQTQYTQLVNQIEVAKMQRQLLQEQAAIAQSRQQIAQVNSQTVNLGGTTDSTLAAANNTAPLKLVYVDNQNDQWAATVSYYGQYQKLGVGSLLPDGSEVLAINNAGVIVKHIGRRELLTFNGMKVLPKTVMAQNTVKPVAPKVATPAAASAPVVAYNEPKPTAVVNNGTPQQKICIKLQPITTV